MQSKRLLQNTVSVQKPVLWGSELIFFNTTDLCRKPVVRRSVLLPCPTSTWAMAVVDRWQVVALTSAQAQRAVIQFGRHAVAADWANAVIMAAEQMDPRQWRVKLRRYFRPGPRPSLTVPGIETRVTDKL